MIAERRNTVDMDLYGLSEGEIAFIRRLASFLREKAKREKEQEKPEEIRFRSWRLGKIKDTLSRKGSTTGSDGMASPCRYALPKSLKSPKSLSSGKNRAALRFLHGDVGGTSGTLRFQRPSPKFGLTSGFFRFSGDFRDFGDFICGWEEQVRGSRSAGI